MWLKQSTAVTIKFGPFLDDTDGKTAETGLAIAQADIRLSKNGGNIAQSNNVAGATHDELGYYDVPLDGTDTNTLGTLRVAVSSAGALPVWQDFMVVPANIWDSMFGSSTQLVTLANGAHGGDTASLQLDGALGLTSVTGISADMTGDITGNLSGSVGSVSAIANGAITANAIAANAITDAKINAGAITGDKIADDAISGLKIADGAITAGKIGADAITAAKVAADVHAEAADAIWDEAAGDHVGVGSVGKLMNDNLDAPISTVDTVVDAIKLKTDNLPADPAGETSIAVVDANVDAILLDTAEIGAAGAGLTALGGMSAGMKGEVNAEVKDVIDTDTHAEPGQGAPGATLSLKDKINYLYKSWRNKKTNDGTDTKLYNDAEDTVDQKQTTSEAAGTVTKGEWITGA